MFLIVYAKDELVVRLNKTVSILSLVFCLSFTLFMVHFKVSAYASDGVLYVPGDYLTIQEAIDASVSGGTVFVSKGTYYEHVVINKSLCLIGENRDLSIIDGNSTGVAVFIDRTNNVTIRNFTIRNSVTGIKMQHSSQNIIECSKILYNNYGIGFYSSIKNTISKNTITLNSGRGIDLYYSGSNFIFNNNISANSLDGISLSYSSNNLIYRNTISLNEFYGVYLIDYSRNNTIYHNNFNNAEDASCGIESINTWDHEGEGNYWSKYNGTDLSGDGVGDSVYPIDGRNTDSYPLMGLFFDYYITFRNETYSVNIISNSTISNFRFEIGIETGSRMLRFYASSASTVGFCRVRISVDLMEFPYLIAVGVEEIAPVLLNSSDETSISLYFTYTSNQTISIVSPELSHLYNELLGKYAELQTAFASLNSTYGYLLLNYSVFYQEFQDLKMTIQAILNNYDVLHQELNLNNQILLNLNMTYYELLGNYTFLQQDLAGHYQNNAVIYSETLSKFRDIVYILVFLTTIFMVTTIYLSKKAQISKRKY